MTTKNAHGLLATRAPAPKPDHPPLTFSPFPNGSFAARTTHPRRIEMFSCADFVVSRARNPERRSERSFGRGTGA